MPAVSQPLPDINDIIAASGRIKPYSVVTPLLEHPSLNERSGGRILLKAENLQRVSAFKFRGAYNKISQVDKEAFPGGVVACSSGNHAQGVAAAATICGIRATIVMPKDAPALKIARTKTFGAEVVLYDRATEDREAIAKGLCADRQAAFVHPFDDPDIIAGQGTVGLELMKQAAAMDVVPDAVLMGSSGGGLLSGVSIAVKTANPDTAIYCVEPGGFDDFQRSLKSGQLEHNERLDGSVCDSLLSQHAGELPFAIARKTVSGGLTVTDEEAMAAVRFAFFELKLVLEPGGAAALAAVLSNKIETKGRAIAVVLSGGNIDASLFTKIIQ